ncbi:MAG: XisI protein [Cyanobacteria bacterium J06627_15]
MSQLMHYQNCIEKLLTAHGERVPVNGEIECQLVFDRQHHHYQLVDLGWDDQHRVYNCVFHLDIKDDKIWIQRNQTDTSIVEEMISMGVDKNDIFLGLQPPYIREMAAAASDAD